MKKSSYIIALLAASALVPSCISLDTAPYDRETDLTYWSKNKDAAISSLNTCYNYIPTMNEIYEMEGATDNAYVKGVTTSQPIANGKYDTANDYVQGVWNYKYAGIRACNELLGNIDKVPSLEEGLKARYIAEAKTIRAFLYYELYTKYGAVPYTTGVLTVKESESIARTERARVVANVKAELNEVISSNTLPATYTGKDRGRITIGAAKAILAKVHLFEGEFNEVKTLTEEIMTSDTYTLFPDYNGLFEASNEYNSEIILDTQYAPALREYSMRDLGFVPPSMGGYCNIAPLQELVDSYIMLNGKGIKEAGSGYTVAAQFVNRDPRLAATIIYTGNSYVMADGTKTVIDCQSGRDAFASTSDVTPTGYYLRKGWDKNYRLTLLSGLNPILIRYADILLMNAEANVELGSFTSEVWKKTIRPIRERAGFTEAGALDFNASADNREIVRNERRCELAFEGGLRIKDIVRWKIAEKVLNGNCHGLYTGEALGTDNGFFIVEKRSFDASKHYFWPIPQKDRDINKNLDQNINW